MLEGPHALAQQDAENARMAKLYREHVLQEKPAAGLVSIDSLAPRPVAKKVEVEEEVGSFGD